MNLTIQQARAIIAQPGLPLDSPFYQEAATLLMRAKLLAPTPAPNGHLGIDDKSLSYKDLNDDDGED